MVVGWCRRPNYCAYIKMGELPTILRDYKSFKVRGKEKRVGTFESVIGAILRTFQKVEDIYFDFIHRVCFNCLFLRRWVASLQLDPKTDYYTTYRPTNYFVINGFA